MSGKYNKLSEEQIKEGKETVEIFQELDQTALKSEKFLEKYSKYLVGVFALVLVSILGYLLINNL